MWLWVLAACPSDGDKDSATPADIEVSPSSLAFVGEAMSGLSEPQQLRIRNVGGGPLRIDTIEADRPFVATGEGTHLESQTELVVDVQYRPLDDLLHIGVLYVHSDDPDEPMVEVTLTGSPKR